MFVRTALAVLDHNANCRREQQVGRGGNLLFTVKVGLQIGIDQFLMSPRF
jgi:hypothetical protein